MQPTQQAHRVVPHESTDISSEVASAGRRAEVLLGVEPICVDHEVAVRQKAEMYMEGDTVGLFSTCNKFYWRYVSTYISGDLDLFFPLKNSGSARFSIE